MCDLVSPVSFLFFFNTFSCTDTSLLHLLYSCLSNSFDPLSPSLHISITTAVRPNYWNIDDALSVRLEFKMFPRNDRREHRMKLYWWLNTHKLVWFTVSNSWDLLPPLIPINPCKDDCPFVTQNAKRMFGSIKLMMNL